MSYVAIVLLDEYNILTDECIIFNLNMLFLDVLPQTINLYLMWDSKRTTLV